MPRYDIHVPTAHLFRVDAWCHAIADVCAALRKHKVDEREIRQFRREATENETWATISRWVRITKKDSTS